MSHSVDALPESAGPSATFLRAEADKPPRGPLVPALTIGERKALRQLYPELLTGPAFAAHALERLQTHGRFCVLAARIDPSDPAAPRRVPTEILLHAAAGLEAVCRSASGLWGVLDNGLLVAYFPDSDARDGLRLAERAQQQFGARCPRTITIGVADFPLLDYERGACLDNAVKAIDHATFFGPGSRAAFDAVSLNVSADRYYARGELAEATRELAKALALDPGNVNVHNSLGVCHGERGDLAAAQAEFETALRLDPREAMAAFNLGQVALQRGEQDKALERFQAAERLDGQRFEIQLALGRLHLEAGKPERAKPCLEKASELNEQSALALRLLAECYERLSMKELAANAYRRTVRLRPNDAESLSALGALYDSLGENREIALLFCRQSVTIAPDNGLYHLRLGRVLASQKHWSEALQVLRQAEVLGQAEAAAEAAHVAALVTASAAGSSG